MPDPAYKRSYLGALHPLDSRQNDVTIVGGGIAGLLTAYFLDQKGYLVTLLEAEDRVGGLIRSTQSPWGLVESGAHSLLVTPPVEKLFRELEVELLPVNADSRSRYILRDQKMQRFPLTVRETCGAFLKACFQFSCAKNQLNVSKSTLHPSHHETLEEWTQKFLGQAALDYLINPMLQGIYAAQPHEISVAAAFPGLLIPAGHTLLSYQISQRLKKKKNHSQMMAPKNGMESLVKALENVLRARLGDRFQTQTRVNTLPSASNLILTTPSSVTAHLLKDQAPQLSKSLQAIQYSPLVSVTVFLNRQKLDQIPKGVGVLIPQKEKRDCLGILFNSSSYPERVVHPDQAVSCTLMLRERPPLFEGASSSLHSKNAPQNSEADILKRVEKELNFFFGTRVGLQPDLSSSPSLLLGSFIHSWTKAIPQYNAELLDCWSLAQQTWCQTPGQILFGNYTGQVSIRGMIESASLL